MASVLQEIRRNGTDARKYLFKSHSVTRWEFIPIKPMSVNEAWKGRRSKTVKYLKYQSAVALMLPRLTLPAPPYRVSFEYGFSTRASDIDNPTKQILDILSKRYKFNDNLVYEMHLTKTIVPKGKEFIKWKIESLENQ